MVLEAKPQLVLDAIGRWCRVQIDPLPPQEQIDKERGAKVLSPSNLLECDRGLCILRPFPDKDSKPWPLPWTWVYRGFGRGYFDKRLEYSESAYIFSHERYYSSPFHVWAGKSGLFRRLLSRILPRELIVMKIKSVCSLFFDKPVYLTYGAQWHWI